MAATVIPLLALFVILLMLWVGIASTVRNRRRALPMPDENRSEEDMRQVQEALRDALDRKPLGIALAQRVWDRLQAEEPGRGVIREHHRDFCGQGLIRTDDGVMLCDVYDGGYDFGKPIAEWKSHAAFVAFLSGQSDFTMSGWDPDEPVFFTQDEWYRNNQRLTRAVLERYLAGF